MYTYIVFNVYYRFSIGNESYITFFLFVYIKLIFLMNNCKKCDVTIGWRVSFECDNLYLGGGGGLKTIKLAWRNLWTIPYVLHPKYMVLKFSYFSFFNYDPKFLNHVHLIAYLNSCRKIFSNKNWLERSSLVFLSKSCTLI